MEPIRLDNDFVLEPQQVTVGQWTLTLDPNAYTTRLEVLLSNWSARSNALVAEARKLEEAGDFAAGEAKFQEEREYIAGLLEQILAAHTAPLDLRDITAVLSSVERVYRQCVQDGDTKPLAVWIEDARARLGQAPNAGWDRQAILDRLSGVKAYAVIDFFVRIGTGTMRAPVLELLRPQNPAAVPDASASDRGPASSPISSKPSRGTRTKAS